MTSEFRKIFSVSFGLALMLSTFCVPAVVAKEQTLDIPRGGISIWIPDKPLITDKKDNMDMYVVKRKKEGKKGFIIVVTFIEKSSRSKIDKHYLEDVIEGEQYGFEKRAKKDGKKVVSEFDKKVSGIGWTGARYRIKIGDKTLLKLYGICDKCVFVLTAANQDMKDNDVVRMFSSIKISSESKPKSPSI